MNKEEKSFSFKRVLGVLVLVLVIGATFIFINISSDTSTSTSMQKIEDQVATDAVNQYNIAKKSSDPIQICVQAGLVAAAYLQAKDESNYLAWKETEKADCKRAGM